MRRLRTIGLILALVLAGCAGLFRTTPPEEGIVLAGYDRVWDAALKVLGEQGFTVKEQMAGRGTIRAEREDPVPTRPGTTAQRTKRVAEITLKRETESRTRLVVGLTVNGLHHEEAQLELAAAIRDRALISLRQ